MCNRLQAKIFETSFDLCNVLVIIPVRNEEATIARVIQDLQNFGLTNIRVVDNGSSDRSSSIATTAGAEVLLEPQTGYGQACWRGLQAIASEIEWILFCDGDGSDDLNCLPEFLSLRQRYDLILGDRRATPKGKAVMTPVQHFGNGFAGWLINLGWRHKYHDLGPLRLIRRTSLEQIAMQDRGFGWTVEMQVRAIEEDLKVWEIPVNYRPRQGGKSKISGTISGSIQAGTIILSTLGKLYLSRQSRNRGQTNKLHNQIFFWLSILLLVIGAIVISPYGDFRQPDNVIHFGYGIAVMCLGFIGSWKLKSLSWYWFWLVAIATRLIVLPMYPGDDIWRYLWEGYLQNLGFSPYDFAPNAQALIPYRTEWWSQINHPGVSAIYPPLAQLGFRGLASISPSVYLFKSSFAIADLLICWLLTKKFTYLETTFYAWNPLVIYSFAGGGHYDSWFILPLVAAWVCWDQGQLGEQTINSVKAIHPKGLLKDIPSWYAPPRRGSPLLVSLLIGISIAVKWISLPMLGFISCTGLKMNLKTAVLIASGLFPVCLSALAFCSVDSCALIPTSSTFVSHGRSAEFLPHLLTKVWHPSTKTNSIFALPLGLITLWLIWKVKSFQELAIAFFASVLTISPIIHVWYFTWIIPFAVGTKNWGVSLVSISAFVYFVLPYRQALGDRHWHLTDNETWLLWLPLIVGLCWSYSQRLASPK
jgi:glycosyltransferase involved in cell wall biosynthesis